MRNIFCLSVVILLSLLFFSSSKNAESFLPQNDLWLGVDDKAAGGLSEEEFNAIIDKVFSAMRPYIKNKNYNFSINKDWINGTVNANVETTYSLGNYAIFNFYGGLARHPLITTDAFAEVVCHEISHITGGIPLKDYRGISNEGQSDYIAAMKCLREVFLHDDNIKIISTMSVSPFVLGKCAEVYSSKEEQALCIRRIYAGYNINRVMANVDNTPDVSFQISDTTVVTEMFNGHPNAQCRLDTSIAGALCNKDLSDGVSYNDAKDGTCNQGEDKTGFRPACWYAPLFSSGPTKVYLESSGLDSATIRWETSEKIDQVSYRLYADEPQKQYSCRGGEAVTISDTDELFERKIQLTNLTSGKSYVLSLCALQYPAIGFSSPKVLRFTTPTIDYPPAPAIEIKQEDIHEVYVGLSNYQDQAANNVRTYHWKIISKMKEEIVSSCDQLDQVTVSDKVRFGKLERNKEYFIYSCTKNGSNLFSPIARATFKTKDLYIPTKIEINYVYATAVNFSFDASLNSTRYLGFISDKNDNTTFNCLNPNDNRPIGKNWLLGGLQPNKEYFIRVCSFDKLTGETIASPAIQSFKTEPILYNQAITTDGKDYTLVLTPLNWLKTESFTLSTKICRLDRHGVTTDDCQEIKGSILGRGENDEPLMEIKFNLTRLKKNKSYIVVSELLEFPELEKKIFTYSAI